MEGQQQQQPQQEDNYEYVSRVKSFFHTATNSYSYVVDDKKSGECIVVDPVLDFDLHLMKTWSDFADQIIAYLKENNLKPLYILETHCHADHVTAGTYLKGKMGGKVGIGKNIRTVQQTFKEIFNFSDSYTENDGFDLLLDESSDITIGSLKCQVLETPGHTPACLTYVIGDAVFVGDTVFQPDYGCARCDFPGGSAEQLYHSVTNKTYTLPDHYRVFVCHDYHPEKGRKHYLCETTIKEQKNSNVWINQFVSNEDFVNRRKERDSKLMVPKLLYPSLQLNLRAGMPPPAESNGKFYMKFPFSTDCT
eukprot:TRINITY_DN3567_c1_g1_i2.p1 TRINITY_DN3567_c1_g1~~TRINITY_DN3567_c1_g1_i2.p1  ORF type:complete len:307 (-),score=78.94 TRINITY_DN3567_c1_g1_i2:30-950(-)